jgi:hypothetical protein
VGALPSGSYLAASQLTAEHDADRVEATAGAFRGSGLRGELRDSRDFADLAFGGLDLVPPRVTLVSQWRPDEDGPRPAAAEVSLYGGVARKR